MRNAKTVVRIALVSLAALSAAASAASPAASPAASAAGEAARSAAVEAAGNVPLGLPLWASIPDVKAFTSVEDTRIAAAQKAIDAIANASGPRTIENTLVPYDDATRNLDSTAYQSGLMEEVAPDAQYRDAATAMTRKVSAVQTDLSLNRKVYDALSAVDLSGADAATKYYVTRQLLLFRLSGVDKDDATRARLKILNDELTEENSALERNIADDLKTTEADPAELKGLPQDYIDRHKPGPDGKVKITTAYPDTLPALKFAESPALRRRLFETFENRAYPKNKDVLMRMASTRAEIAKLLGFSTWADLNAAPRMASTSARVAQFIRDVDAAARPIMEREFAELLAEKRKREPNASEVFDFENSYLSEQVRRAGFDFDSQSVRPYFPYAEVRRGILDTASKLFHLTFQPEANAPGWDKSVETFQVREGDQRIGRIYLDMHPRPGKYTHANMVPVEDGIAGKQLPEAALVCNFPAPTATDAGLMEYGDVVTFFHEFGHLMHWILAGRQRWAGLNFGNLELDFVEAPSQMLEEFMRSPQVLQSFAKHYRTGETIPSGLVAKMNRASTFGRGSGVAVQNALSAISYEVYTTDPARLDLDAITFGAWRKYTKLSPISGTHFWASFAHLGGYSSAYYTYMWDKVIAEDFASQFDKTNLLAPGPSMRYRRTVLEPGGSMSANDLVKNFLGRPQNMQAFEKWMGEEFEGEGAKGPGGK